MRCEEASTTLKGRLHSHGVEHSSLVPETGFAEMFAFYRDVRPVNCAPIEHDGDMLLYQWGTFDWGFGKYFNLNMTRQFVAQDLGEDVEDDDALFQLELTFLYPPMPVLDALRQGNRWCHSPAELSDFQQFVFSSSAYRTVLEFMPIKAELLYQNVG